MGNLVRDIASLDAVEKKLNPWSCWNLNPRFLDSPAVCPTQLSQIHRRTCNQIPIEIENRTCSAAKKKKKRRNYIDITYKSGRIGIFRVQSRVMGVINSSLFFFCRTERNWPRWMSNLTHVKVHISSTYSSAEFPYSLLILNHLPAHRESNIGNVSSPWAVHVKFSGILQRIGVIEMQSALQISTYCG